MNNDWLDEVIEEGGWKCAACGHWRLLKGREIEPCICGDDGFDIYEADIASRWATVGAVMKTTLETLKRKFIKPNDSVTKFPVRDGYYWLQWPEREQRPDPRTGKPHMEVCQWEQGAVLLIGTREDYSKQMKGRAFRFFGPIALPFEAGTQ